MTATPPPKILITKLGDIKCERGTIKAQWHQIPQQPTGTKISNSKTDDKLVNRRKLAHKNHDHSIAWAARKLVNLSTQLQQHGQCFVTATNNSQEGTYAEGICHGTIILQGKINKGVVLGLRGWMDFEPVVDGLSGIFCGILPKKYHV
jgi:hypothetical protein